MIVTLNTATAIQTATLTAALDTLLNFCPSAKESIHGIKVANVTKAQVKNKTNLYKYKL